MRKIFIIALAILAGAINTTNTVLAEEVSLQGSEGVKLDTFDPRTPTTCAALHGIWGDARTRSGGGREAARVEWWLSVKTDCRFRVYHTYGVVVETLGDVLHIVPPGSRLYEGQIDPQTGTGSFQYANGSRAEFYVVNNKLKQVISLANGWTAWTDFKKKQEPTLEKTSNGVFIPNNVPQPTRSSRIPECESYLGLWEGNWDIGLPAALSLFSIEHTEKGTCYILGHYGWSGSSPGYRLILATIQEKEVEIRPDRNPLLTNLWLKFKLQTGQLNGWSEEGNRITLNRRGRIVATQ